MKKNLFILAAAAMLAAVSCQEEIAAPEIDSTNEGAFTITASVGVETKTVLGENGTSSYWAKGDKISVFDSKKEANNRCFKIVEEGVDFSQDQKTATFGSDEEFTWPQNNQEDPLIVSLYPYQPDAYCDFFYYDRNYITGLNIPVEQTAVAGGFDSSATFALATGKYSTKDDLKFTNLYSLLKVSVVEENVKTITANETQYDVIDIGFSSGSESESAKVCDFIYMNAVKPYYEYDTELAYFVDYGDHNTQTATGSDKFGYYNCLTEQLYGEDQVTGVSWGLIDDDNDQYGGSSKSKGIFYTANTWGNEYNTADGQDKTSSYRYTKNQYENNIERHIDYGFSLPNGTYRVEVGFADPWGCSNKPSVYAYYGTENAQTLTENLDLSSTKTASANVKVTDGNLVLNFCSEDKAINITYIKIYFDNIEELPYKSVNEDIIGDVNADGAFNISDIVVMQKWLLGDGDLTDWKAGDLCEDNVINVYDLCLMRRMLIHKI